MSRRAPDPRHAALGAIQGSATSCPLPASRPRSSTATALPPDRSELDRNRLCGAVWARHRAGAAGFAQRYGLAVSGDSCIVVSGEGVAFGVPDRCLLSVAFNVLRETPAEAVAAVATVVDAAIGALRDAGVDAANIRTLNLAVRDWFDQRSQQVTARVATYALVVSNRRLDEVSRLLDALAAAAGESLQIQGLMLTVADDSSLRANARRSAVQDATTRARQLADAAGVRLGPIVTIEEAAVPGPRGGFEFSARQVAATAAAPMPVEAGTAAVTVRITMTFAIDAGDSAPQSAPLH